MKLLIIVGTKIRRRRPSVKGETKKATSCIDSIPSGWLTWIITDLKNKWLLIAIDTLANQDGTTSDNVNYDYLHRSDSRHSAIENFDYLVNTMNGESAEGKVREKMQLRKKKRKELASDIRDEAEKKKTVKEKWKLQLKNKKLVVSGDSEG